MAEGLIISTGVAAVWLPWLMTGAMIQLCLVCLMQPRYLHALLSNSVRPFTTNAGEQLPSIGAQIGQWLLNVVLMAVSAYVYAISKDEYPSMAVLLLAATGIDVLRLAAAMAVTYTFELKRALHDAYMRYFSLRSIYTLALMIPVLLMYNGIRGIGMQVAIILLTAAYYVLLGVQWAKLYCTTPIDILFIIIYLATAEVLPTCFLMMLPGLIGE